MITLPSSNNWQINQKSDLFGNIIATKNMDFDKEGYVGIAKKSVALSSSSVVSSYGLPLVVLTDGTNHYVVGKNTFSVYDFTLNPYLEVVFSSGGSIPFFDNYTDGVLYERVVTVSGQSTVATYTGGTSGTWATKISGLSVNYPHPLCIMENRQTLLVGNGNVLNQYDSTYTLDSTNQLTLPADYVIEWIRYRQSTAVIGTRNIVGGEAKVFFWNGTGVAFQTAYGVGSDWTYSGVEYQSSMVIIASSGRILRFNGAGWDELASLPVYSTPYAWTSNAVNSSMIGKVASRGMGVHGDVLYINLDGSLNVRTNENPGTYLSGQPSGLWVYDPAVGLYHKGGYASDSILDIVPTSVDGSSVLTFAVPHQTKTGDPILYMPNGTGGTLVNVNIGQTYYAIPTGLYTVELALSADDALLGKKIAISGTITGDSFYFHTHTQEGASQVTTPGCIFVLGIPHLLTFYGTEVMYGATVKDASLTDRNVLMSLGDSYTKGYFITPKIQSAQTQDALAKLYLKFSEMNFSTDKIIVKYRNATRLSIPTKLNTGTWTYENMFTVNEYSNDFNNVIVGDEIEIIGGAAAGYSTHVTAITLTGTTYTVTVSELLPVVPGNTFQFVADNWTKEGTLTGLSENSFANFGEGNIGKASTWSQFKIELAGNNIVISQAQVINSPHKSST